MDESRYLLVTADDFGIGPKTSRGILDLAAQQVLTSTVLLVNSPHAAECVSLWRRAGEQLELGWHPCLTLDRPILPATRVPSLVDESGRFLPLGGFLKQYLRGRIVRAEVEAELRAQFDRFIDLVGYPPANVNAHHHVHIFGLVGDALRAVLDDVTPRPFVRRVTEPVRTLFGVRGARVKRVVLSRVGKQAAAAQHTAGLPGTDWLIGITDPPFVRDPDFFVNWLRRAPGRFIELTCHPGHLDETIDGRDGSLTDGQLHRRERELELLGHPRFAAAVRQAGFVPVTAARLAELRLGSAAPRRLVRQAG
ncbi:carbohydrate deacetylase [Fimbriiglobus ruber]|uniref:Cellobiose phosphotransferase system YdjC-like protein n=1 Tax=Fimbriiglobus ruber TaxID=1908690 RepID=A0A225E2I3_9BACT|nr:ChbG/HpnK family deacetylase [Fimbriiglobus ruber]OWK43699.1 Cellobiose phosphotransferase system YdjC-like protein [Fimbriiglobus ruber]